MRSYTVKENHIGSAVSEILWFTHADRDKDPNTFIRIILLFRLTIHASERGLGNGIYPNKTNRIPIKSLFRCI